MKPSHEKPAGQRRSGGNDLRHLVSWLREQPPFTKVVLGPFRFCRHQQPVGTLRILSSSADGFRVSAYAADGIRELYLYHLSSMREEARGLILLRSEEL